jgi:hypothetical protein
MKKIHTYYEYELYSRFAGTESFFKSIGQIKNDGDYITVWHSYNSLIFYRYRVDSK